MMNTNPSPPIENEQVPTVSVVVPVYNVQPWLKESIDSITNQTLKNIEIICVDDGSTDASLQILQEYAARDERIRILTQENQGPSQARNAGVRAAQGKYLYFMDGDDILNANALERCVSEMEARRLEMLCFNASAFGESPQTKTVAEDLNQTYFGRTLNEEKVYEKPALYLEMIQNHSLEAVVWASVMLRSAFLEHNLWFHPGMLHEDEVWIFRALTCLSRYGCINDTLFRYRIREGSVMRCGKWTFAHVYGLFYASCHIQNYFEQHPEYLDKDEDKNAVKEHCLLLQKRAFYKYRCITEEEKQKRADIPEADKVLFEQTVVIPADLQKTAVNRNLKINALQTEIDKLKDAHQTLTQQYAALTKTNEELTAELLTLSADNLQLKETVKQLKNDKEAQSAKIKKLKKDNKKLKEKIAKIKASKSYRIGRALTRFPRKIKALFKTK